MFRLFMRDLILALSCASIIIGAGLLSLPLVAAPLGFVPVLGVIAGMGIWMMLVYTRIAESLYSFLRRRARSRSIVLKTGLRVASGENGRDREEGSLLTDVDDMVAAEIRKYGVRQIAEQVRASGLGRAGIATLLYGMFMYVFFADIGYILFGSRTLQQIAQFAGERAPSLSMGFNAADIFAAHDIPSIAVAVITFAVDLSILGMAIWLLRSEPEKLPVEIHRVAESLASIDLLNEFNPPRARSIEYEGEKP